MWFIIAIVAHLSNAVAFLFDKALLTKRLPHPGVAAFWVGVGSTIALGLLFFDFRLPASGVEWLLDFLGGFLFIAALVVFYGAMRSVEVSRVVPIVGGSVPVFTVFLASLFGLVRLERGVWVAVLVLALGALLMTWVHGKHKPLHLTWMLSAGFLFAASSIVMDAVFVRQGFFAGFAWSRLGALAFALLLLAHRPTRRALMIKEHRQSVATLLGASQVLGAVGFFLLNLAISLKNAVLVNALQGIQYVFLFVLALVAAKRFPTVFHESFDKSVILQKSVGIVVIIGGLVILSLG